MKGKIRAVESVVSEKQRRYQYGLVVLYPQKVIGLMNWWLARGESRKRQAMWAGGSFADVTQSAYLRVFKLLKEKEAPLYVKPTTFVLNHLKWELHKLVARRNQQIVCLKDMEERDPGHEEYGRREQEDWFEPVIRVQDKDALREALLRVLKKLTYREREIIKLRYGLGNGGTYTLEEVGRIFKVTRERVKQIESKALKRLQHHSYSESLVPFVANSRDENEDCCQRCSMWCGKPRLPCFECGRMLCRSCLDPKSRECYQCRRGERE